MLKHYPETMVMIFIIGMWCQMLDCQWLQLMQSADTTFTLTSSYLPPLMVIILPLTNLFIYTVHSVTTALSPSHPPMVLFDSPFHPQSTCLRWHESDTGSILQYTQTKTRYQLFRLGMTTIAFAFLSGSLTDLTLLLCYFSFQR